MNILKYIWNWFAVRFHQVGATHPPAYPEVVVEAVEEAEDTEVEEELPDYRELTWFPPNFPLRSLVLEDDFFDTSHMENAARLAKNLNTLSQELGKDLIILSGYRTPEGNKLRGGSKDSKHLLGLAADIKVKGMSRQKLAAKIKELIKEGKMDKGGVGIYPTYVHYDVRGKNVSWTVKTNKK